MCLVFGFPFILSIAANEWRILLTPLVLCAVAYPICRFGGSNRTAFTSRSATSADFARFPSANVWDGIASESVTKLDAKLKSVPSEAYASVPSQTESLSLSADNELTFMVPTVSDCATLKEANVELVCVKSAKLNEDSASADEMKESLLCVDADQSIVPICV